MQKYEFILNDRDFFQKKLRFLMELRLFVGKKMCFRAPFRPQKLRFLMELR